LSCVIFTEKEYKKISKAKIQFGESIPSLLKKAYFQASVLIKEPLFTNAPFLSSTE